MRSWWRWGCLAAVLCLLQVVTLWRWLPTTASSSATSSVTPAAIANHPPDPAYRSALSKECRAALTALQTATERDERFYRVTTAHVIVADYAGLRRDFARLRGLRDEAIDAWLLDEVAFLSSNHFAHVRPCLTRPPAHRHQMSEAQHQMN